MTRASCPHHARGALVCALLAACAPEPVSLTVTAQANGADARCGNPVSGLVGTAEIASLKWFVSEPAAIVDGAEVPLTFAVDDAWQTERVALIDLDDGSGPCAAQGTPQTNDRLRFDDRSARALSGDVTAFVFTLGVPFEDNHQDPAAAPPPLNDPTMFWAWQSGYKFVRIDLVAEAGPWNLHLGAAGCASDGLAVAPSVDCERPNRPRIAVQWPGPDSGPLTLDLDTLLAGSDLTTNAPGSPPGCMASPDDTADCTPVFDALGLDWATGAACDGCEATAFRVP